MFRNKLIVICLLVAGCSALINGQVLPNIPRDGTKVIPALSAREEATQSTTTTTTTTTTTPAPTTTTTTSPTPAPTTTTPAPSTAKPNTTTTTAKPDTTTTTAKPDTTTTTAKPDTTTAGPNPVPFPEPPMGKWNSTCIWLQMATQLNVTYETADNLTKHALYNIPATATVYEVMCESNNTQAMTLHWGPESALHMMTVAFERNNSKVNVHTIYITLPIDADEFTNPKANQTVNLLYRGDIFEAPSHMSYHCTRPQVFNMTEAVIDQTVIGTMRLSDVQMEAFRKENSTSFSTAHDCDSSETPDIVPIAVGIALVALILIVLVSYLCARRRSTARGYMSF